MNKQKFFIFTFLMVFCLMMSCFETGSAKVSKEEIKDSKITEETKLITGELTEEEKLARGEESAYEENFSQYLTGKGVTIIGDSIVSGNRGIILNQLPDALIEAKGSRDVCGGFEAAQKLQQEGKLSDVVIVELGTNGPLLNHEPYATGTKNLLELLGTERQIFWVTVYCSYSQWMDMNNNYIWELSASNPNITIIDWYSLAISHPEWFPDGVHPNLEGARQFANLLRESLAEKYGANNF